VSLASLIPIGHKISNRVAKLDFALISVQKLVSSPVFHFS
jgi:hypothetical protein